MRIYVIHFMLICLKPCNLQGACVADYSYAKTRAEELQKFIHHPECFAMLLSKEGVRFGSLYMDEGYFPI